MSELVTYLTMIFVASSIMLLISGRFSHPAIPSYILAGIVVGLFIEGEALIPMAQWGIVFLVFLFGIKTEQDRIASLTRESITITFIQVMAIAALVYGVTYTAGMNNLNALYLSIAAALSSSLIGLGMVEEELRMNLLHGRLTESVNLMQDLIGLFLIIVITTTPFELYPVLVNIVYGAMLIVAGLLVRDYVFPGIAERAGGSRELLMLTGMTVLIGFVFLAAYFDLSIVVGAFAAGMAVSKYPYKLEELDIMSPLKDFFSAIFFVVLGALVTVPGIRTLLIAVGLIGITSFVKPAIVTLLMVKSGYDNRTAFLTSMGLDHVSEFALIVAIQAFVAQTIFPHVFQAIIFAAVITMISSSYTSRHAEELYRLLERHDIITPNFDKLNEHTHISDDLADHTILVGYGVQGKLIAEALRDANEPFVVVDNDPEEITEANRIEDNTVFGNVMDEHTWKRANAEDAHLIVSTIPHAHSSHRILDVDTDADIILRADTFNDAEALIERGATYVAVPDLLAADQLNAIVRGALTSGDYAEDLRNRNLLELRSYFYADDRYDKHPDQ